MEREFSLNVVEHGNVVRNGASQEERELSVPLSIAGGRTGWPLDQRPGRDAATDSLRPSLRPWCLQRTLMLATDGMLERTGEMEGWREFFVFPDLFHLLLIFAL